MVDFIGSQLCACLVATMIDDQANSSSLLAMGTGTGRWVHSLFAFGALPGLICSLMFPVFPALVGCRLLAFGHVLFVLSITCVVGIGDSRFCVVCQAKYIQLVATTI